MRTIKDFRKLHVKALAGNKNARDELVVESRKIVVEANRRMCELKSHGAAYGKTFNRAENFNITVHGKSRFLKPSELSFDIDDVLQTTEEALLFLESEFSRWENVRTMEKSRKDLFVERGWVDENISDRSFRNFLRFLGNEETQNILQDWTSSDDVVEMLFDLYTNKINTKQQLLAAFAEYNDAKANGGKSFNQMMESLSIDVLDYPKRGWF